MIESIILTSLIKKELIGQTIGESTKSIFHQLGGMLEHKEFKDIISDLDLKPKIDIVNDLINKIDHQEMDNVMHKALHYLHDIIDLINKEIKEINNDITEHKKLWFHNFRQATYPSKIENLIKHNTILDRRLDLLLKIIHI